MYEVGLERHFCGDGTHVTKWRIFCHIDARVSEKLFAFWKRGSKPPSLLLPKKCIQSPHLLPRAENLCQNGGFSKQIWGFFSIHGTFFGRKYLPRFITKNHFLLHFSSTMFSKIPKYFLSRRLWRRELFFGRFAPEKGDLTTPSPKRGRNPPPLPLGPKKRRS